jgi:hypothetical protein
MSEGARQGSDEAVELEIKDISTPDFTAEASNLELAQNLLTSVLQIVPTLGEALVKSLDAGTKVSEASAELTLAEAENVREQTREQRLLNDERQNHLERTKTAPSLVMFACGISGISFFLGTFIFLILRAVGNTTIGDLWISTALATAVSVAGLIINSTIATRNAVALTKALNKNNEEKKEEGNQIGGTA